ncbi:MAG: hypothetical protein WCU88_11855 [Elusimicrobiota bacterium]|jgi:hypothetical protein
MKRTTLSAILFLSAPIFAEAQPVLETAMNEAQGMIVAAKASRRKTARPAKEPEDITIPRFQQKTFPAPAGGACGLKSFTLLDYENRSKDGEHEYARISIMGAVIETTSPDCIRDYGVVQFIRGCVYNSRHSVKTGALLEQDFSVNRRLRGAENVVFNHPTYEVDQMETDPLYASFPQEAGRLDLAYVPHTPLKLRPETPSMLSDFKAFNESNRRTFLKDHPGPTSVIFVSDMPLGGITYFNAQSQEVSATNSSLDFKTCVYRIQDVPVSGDPAGEDTPPENGGPLQCFSWSSRYTYDAEIQDFATDKFKGIDPFCSQAPARKR